MLGLSFALPLVINEAIADTTFREYVLGIRRIHLQLLP
jgi:hypothetical protein